MSRRKWKLLNNNYDWNLDRTRLYRSPIPFDEPWGLLRWDDDQLTEVANFRSFGDAIQYIEGQERSQS